MPSNPVVQGDQIEEIRDKRERDDASERRRVQSSRGSSE